MDRSELPLLSVAELSRRIEVRELSPVELTEAYLERIEKVDPKLNAYITVTADEAMNAAREAEAEIVGGRYRGPLHGIPVAVKDQMWTKGIRTTNASTLLKDFVPDEDATIVARLRRGCQGSGVTENTTDDPGGVGVACDAAMPTPSAST